MICATFDCNAPICAWTASIPGPRPSAYVNAATPLASVTIGPPAFAFGPDPMAKKTSAFATGALVLVLTVAVIVCDVPVVLVADAGARTMLEAVSGGTAAGPSDTSPVTGLPFGSVNRLAAGFRVLAKFESPPGRA